jgi:hypothetical protein
MRPLRYGDPEARWGNKNLRWGSPSYVLEPGDPGYVPPEGTPSPSNPKPKQNKMPKDSAIKRPDDDFRDQLNTFKTNIGGYATLLEVTPAQVTAQAADADYFTYVMACQEIVQNTGKQWTAWKELAREGGTPPATGSPLPPELPTAVPAVGFGIEVRFRALVQQIKKHPNYNVSIGQILGIEGAVQSGPDLATIQPELKLSLAGGVVQVGWTWQGQSKFLDMIEIQVDRGTGGGFVMLTYDTTPGYTDTTPLPATPAKWKYRAIYRVADARVGQWSSEEAITVGG